jgi:hypothetical protein
MVLDGVFCMAEKGIPYSGGIKKLSLSTPQSYIEELDLQFHTLLTSAVGRTDW